MREDIKQTEKLKGGARLTENVSGDTRVILTTPQHLETESTQQQHQKSESETNQPGLKNNEVLPSENLSRELINHLSKEIETLSNNNNAFRSRSNLSVFLGPFIVLGSFVYALKGSRFSFQLDTEAWVWIVGAGIGYLGIGYMSARIEDHGWEICNRYRKLIARLHNDPKTIINAGPLDDSTDAGILNVKYRLNLTYMIVYGAMLLTLICAIRLATKLEITDIPPKAVEVQTIMPSQNSPASTTQSQ